jgi:transcription antitermination factor NusG
MLPTTTFTTNESDATLVISEAWRGEWRVLHTKSRQEKALSADLGAAGIAHFLPLRRESKYHGPRKVVVESPLFPSYLFLRGSIDDVWHADRTKRVASVIAVPNQEKLQWELMNLCAVLTHQVCLDPYPCLKKGVRVEVCSGPFRGVQGLIEDKPRPDRLVLQVDMLGRAVSLEIDGALLEPLD